MPSVPGESRTRRAVEIVLSGNFARRGKRGSKIMFS
jgi:hypothetical protein